MSNHTHYVLSTMTASVGYSVFDTPAGPDNPVLRKKIVVRGGASIPSLKSGFGEASEDHNGSPLWTPSGVVTPVSKEDYELLKEHPIFIKHQNAGLVKFVGQELMGNHNKVKSVSRDMEKDSLRQLNKDTMATRAKVTTASISQETHVL